MKDTASKEIWFITGSQHLYGEETLKQVAVNSRVIANSLDEDSTIPVSIKHKGVLTTPDEIYQALMEANAAENCIGLIAWMHTFSPAKMWIRGLSILSKPLAHLHTQFNEEIPWGEIDMDFMNLNQSAHGGREFGFMLTRMRKNRKVITGHWKSEAAREKLGTWARVALGWDDLQGMKIARIGDNMREVAVTEGDKVAAQMKLGMAVNGYEVPDLMQWINGVSDKEINHLIEEYEASYLMASQLKTGGGARAALQEAARIEIGLEKFLKNGNFKGFTDTFEGLGDLAQLPGIAVQRLMAKGYGFGAEGDWKTAALLRAMKVMGTGLDGGTSFMEDYTYHFGKKESLVLGAHMLEICPSIAAEKPKCEIHPLGIGGKADPVRLVFGSPAGPAINVSLIDMGNRFRLLVNEVDARQPEQDLPKLPVARVMWKPQPSLEIAASAWILAGGAHHTVYSQSVNTEFIEDLADIAGIELVVIDQNTRLREFKDLLRSNEVYYHVFEKGW
ncbi:MAG: L-arabinose isomerase [Cyclobacteriaceae bacterium]|nr:L-arabinose isomerase [Cyclobacteriaceae bacterium]